MTGHGRKSEGEILQNENDRLLYEYSLERDERPVTEEWLSRFRKIKGCVSSDAYILDEDALGLIIFKQPFIENTFTFCFSGGTINNPSIGQVRTIFRGVTGRTLKEPE